MSKKEKKNLEEKDEEKKEEEKEEESKEEENVEEAAEEEELEIVDEESSEEKKEEDEEMAATLDDVMNAVKALTKVVGGLLAAMKKGKGYGNPEKGDEEEEQNRLSFADLDKEKLLAIVGAIGKEVRALEESKDGMNERTLREFLSKVVAHFPVPEKLEADEEKEEEKPAEGDEKKSEEKAAEEKKPAEGDDSKAEPKGEEEKSEESKEDMARKVLDEIGNLKGSIRTIVSEEISRRVRPRRKGKIEDQVEKLAQERKELQARIDAEPDAEKRLDMYARAAFGKKKGQ